MAVNTVLTPSIIAKEALVILDNQLQMAKSVYRGYEEEYSKNVNGYKVGQTISIRKPAQFTVRTGNVASVQDVVEGTTSLVVDQQIGTDFKFSSVDLTMKIGDLSERVIKPQMVQLANKIDRDLLGLYTRVYNYTGTFGSTLNGFGSFAKAQQRMDEMAVPSDQRMSVVAPADYWDTVSNLTTLYIAQSANPAYRQGTLGGVSGLDVMMSQNVNTFTAGTRTNGTVNGANQEVVYSGAQANLYTQTLSVTGLGANATIAAGDVFTIANVSAVNPVTKAVLPYAQQFTVTTAATASAGGVASLTISPAIITSGAFQTVQLASGTALPSGGVVTWAATASTSYSQNIAFHKNAFALAVVPMDRPPGAVDVARETYKGLSVRVIPVYDGINDASMWRLDVLYGFAAIDPRLATRMAR
jgi:hypothetical protein